MDIQKGIPVADRPAEELIEAMDTCLLCGHKLTFRYLVNYKMWEAHEETHCEACNIKNTVNKYILQ